MKKISHFASQLFAGLLLISSLSIFGLQSAHAGAGLRGAENFPKVTLYNQDGKPLRFYEDVIQGKVVTINFMFTSCGDSCPLETAKLNDVYRLLGNHIGKNVHMYSITVDPDRDTPAALKAYMKKFQIGPGWQFLTGKKKDIDAIRMKLGMYAKDEKELSDHAITFILGNEATGQWLKRTPFDLPQTLVVTLLGRLQTSPLKSTIPLTASYSGSRITRNATGALEGRDLFKSRCASCHTIGQGDRLGPDLLDVVSKRDRNWLVRWLMAPDEMLKVKDPLAMALYEKYNQVNMPNMKLTKPNTSALILYMEQVSKQVKEDLAKSEK